MIVLLAGITVPDRVLMITDHATKSLILEGVVQFPRCLP